MRLNVLITALVLSLAIKADAAAPVELELATERGMQITAPREWLQLLTQMGIDDVRIRGARAGDEPAVESRGTRQRPRYYVLGILTSRDELRLPGGTFGRRDQAGIRDYFDRLAADGAESLTAPRGRFGLSEQELEAVFADFTQPIDFETKGQSPQQVVRQLESKLNHRCALDAVAAAVLREASPCEDELKGITTGTALAMTLRNAGLTVRPEKLRGQPVRFLIAPAGADSLSQSTLGSEADEAMANWPIGWEPDTAPVHVAPELFEQLNAEIDGYTLEETLAALRPRVKLPLYVDRRALAAAKIDPAEIKVALPRTRTSYKRVLDRVLSQARLGGQLRVDEAGRPFLWVTR
jgi:hypothetical protein